MLSSLFWSFMEQGGSKLAQMLVQLILARLLAPEVFGALAILLVFTQVADSIAQSGMGTALIQREHASDADYSTAFWLSLGLAALMYAILFSVSPFVESFYGMPGLAAPLRLLSLVVVFNSANSIQRSYLQKAMDFRTLCMANVIALVVAGIFGIESAVLGFGVWALVVQTLAQGAVSCVILLWLSPWRPSFVFDVGTARELFSYGWKICATGILNTFYTSISELVLGKTCSSGNLGYYSQGRKWPNAAIAMFSSALQNVFLPAFSSLQDNPEALRQSMRRFLSCGSFIVVPMSLFFAVTAEPTVVLLLGDAWLPCANVFRWTVLGNCILMFQLVNLRAYMALGHSDVYLRLQTVKVALGIVATAFAAIAFRSIDGVAFVSMLLSFMFIFGVDMRPAGRLHGYSPIDQVRDVLPIYGAAAIASVICIVSMTFPFMGLARLSLALLAYVSAYIIASRLLHVAALEDLSEIASHIWNR